MTEKNKWINSIKKLCAEFNVDITDEMERFFHDFKDNDTPASVSHHENRKWGNWCHTFNVMKLALAKNRAYLLGYKPYSIVKVCLCHDLDKFVHPLIPKLTTKGKLSVDALTHPDVEVYLGHGEYSLLTAMRYFTIDELEAQAILYHMGFYKEYGPTGAEYAGYYHLIKERMTKFTRLIQDCDMEASQLVEMVFDRDKEVKDYAMELMDRGY